MNVNVKSLYVIVKVVLFYMIEVGYGRIVLVFFINVMLGVFG